MALTKVSGGILDPGINVAGIVTATGFDGPFTGGSTKNITAGIITATGFDLNGNGDISGNLVIGGNLTANGDFTTLNTTLREVEILRVDANSSATAGIITQRGTGDILNLFDNNTEILTVKDGGSVGIGTTNPLQRLHVKQGSTTTPAMVEALGAKSHVRFQHNAGDSYTTTIGSKTLGAGNVGLTFDTGYNGAVQRMTIDVNGNVGIGTDNPDYKTTIAADGINASLNLKRTNTSVNGQAYGNIFYTTETGQNVVLVRGVRESSNADGAFTISTKATSGTLDERFRINSGGNLQLGSSADAGNALRYLDIYNLNTGGSAGSILRFITRKSDDSSSVSADIVKYKTGGLYINNNEVLGTTGFISFGTGTAGGSVTERLRISSSGHTRIENELNALSALNTASNYHLHLSNPANDAGEAVGICFGLSTGRDIGASIYHSRTGTNSYGDLMFATKPSGGGVTERLRIKSDGKVLITNTLGLGGATSNPGDLLHAQSTSGEGKIVVIGATDGTVAISALNGDSSVKFGDSTTENAGNITYDHGTDSLSFRVNAGTRWKFDSNGHFLPDTAGAVNIGSSSAGIGSVFLPDDKRISLGNDEDLQISHSSGNVSLITSPTHRQLQYKSDGGFLIRGSGNQMIANFLESAVTLYKSQTIRLTTTATGIEVTGEVAASQDYPNFRPTLDLNFAAEKKLDPRVVYYRSGPASFTDEFGKVVVVGDNTPRFDHDPVSGESKGLLIETLRTNQWLYSEDLVTYVTGGNLQESTLANTTATTDPRGGTNAVLMAATTAGGAHSFYKNFTSGSNGDVHTFSVWVKAAGVDYARIYVDTVGGNMNGPGVTFSTKNVWNVSATGVATQTRTSVDEYPNGWWRLSVSGSFSNRNDYFCHVDLEGGEADVAFNGNGSDGMYVWGAQFETGSYPSSYIPTNGGVVERGFDNVVIDEEDFTDFYNPLESSVLAVGTVKRPVSAQGQLNIFHVGDSNQDGHGVFREHGTKDIFYHIRNGNATPTGGNLVASGYGDWSEGREAKIAIAFKDGDQAISVNGGNQATATVTSSYPTNNITKMWIGSASGNGSGQFEGTIKRIAYYSKLLTDNQLNTLTA